MNTNQTNNPGNSVRNTPPQKSNNNARTFQITTGILALLLLGSIFYIFNLKGENETQEESLLSVNEERENLQAEIDSLDYEIKNLESLNLKKDTMLTQAREEIQRKSDEIQRAISKGNLSQSEVRRLKSEISALKNEVRSYREQVRKLKEENEQLRYNNDSLSTQNYAIRDTLTNLKGDYQNVKTKYEESDNLIKSTVSISNFNITPVRVRKSGKEVQKEWSRRVNKLKVDFNLDPSGTTSDGTKTLYICIYKPDGSLAKFSNGTMGSFVNKNGANISYSDKVLANYGSTTGGKVQFDWDYDDFVAGTYRIDIWQNGFKIGTENRTLK